MTIAKNDRDFDAFRFVARAVSDDETRYFMCGINIEKGEDGKTVAVATDGWRLHKAELSGIYAEGLYRVVKSSAKEIALDLIPESKAGQFPNWMKVVPDPELPNLGEFHLDDDKRRRGINTSIAAIEIYRKTGRVVDSDYLADIADIAWKMIGDNEKTHDEYQGRAIRFDCANGYLAVIMPTSYGVEWAAEDKKATEASARK